MTRTSRVLPFVTLAALLACSGADDPVMPPFDGGPGIVAALKEQGAVANGSYHFIVPADFNGGIFGAEVGNHVSFTVRSKSDGSPDGRFRYVQTYQGDEFIFSGRITCYQVYDTPVLVRHEDIPPMTANRIKWGGLIEKSNDPTLPAGGYIWFQSIDNDGDPGAHYPDLSTLSGFGDNAANEAFCASPAVPNSRFGPHPVGSGQIVVH